MPSCRTTGAVATLLIAGTAAWADEPQHGGTLHVVVTPEPPMLMQGLNQNGPTNMIAGNIYESLLRYSPDLEPQPSLAREWEVSDDALTYTFHLQEGVTWHDGEPFSAEDVVFSLDVFLPEVHPRWRPIHANQIESISAADDSTVEIVLRQPFGPLMLAMEVASAPIIPAHIYEGTDYAANEMNATPIGTGPFKFEEWERGSYVHLVRNDEYWMEDRPYLDEVYFQFIPDAAARAVAYENGQIDILTGGAVDNFDVARLEAADDTCVTTAGWEMMAPHAWMAINHREEILASREFRQGLMHAIDREFGRDVVWNGFGEIPTGPISSKTRFYDGDVQTYDFDPDRARELIEASGYDGETIELLGLPYGEAWTRWAEAIRQNLGDVGVNVNIVTTDVAGWTQRVGEWDFQTTFNFLYQLGDPAIGVARSYISGNIARGNPFGNVGGYSNEEVDRIFAEAANAATDEERQELYSEVQRILAEDLPVLWLLEMDFPTVYRCNIQNFPTTAIGINDGLRDLWIDGDGDT
jgi:peptide/nickel transport system substrate-binding protein